MLLKQLFDQATWTYTYLLADPDSKEAIIIDPVVERVDRDLQLIDELGLTLLYSLDTHVHADHVTGSGALREKTGAKTGVSAVSRVGCADRALNDGDVLGFGRYALEVRSTPGHTGGCLTFVVEDDDQTLAFTGDALFVRGCGRTDFQQGDAATLYHSVHDKIFTLPANTVVYPGHDYRGHTVSTVAEEKAHNPRLKTSISEQQFVQIMDDLKLAHPKRIHEALPANMACGVPANKPVDDTPPTASTEPIVRARPVIKEARVEALDQYSDHLIIDVRSPQEFAQGHLPNAVLAPLQALNAHALQWQKDTPILAVCRSGARSYMASSALLQMGFTDVTNLVGGVMAWNALQRKSA